MNREHMKIGRSTLNEIGASVDGLAIISTGLSSPFATIRTTVPTSRLVAPGTPDARLEWSSGSRVVSGRLDDCFQEFLRLADVERDDEIVEFANRYGVMVADRHGPRQESRPGVACASTHQRQAYGSEPTRVWRLLSHGFRSILSLERGNCGRLIWQGPDALEAFGALAAARWLNDPPADGIPPSDDDIVSVALREYIRGDICRHASGKCLLCVDPVIETILAYAGVAQIRGVGRKIRTCLRLILPGRVLDDTTSNEPVWVVDGLLPVLITGLLIYLHQGEEFECTRCHKVARANLKKPRKGSPFYGEHTDCRRDARKETWQKADAKRSARRKQERNERANT